MVYRFFCILLAAALVSCGGEQIIKNLKSAADSEALSVARYRYYLERAHSDSLAMIAAELEVLRDEEVANVAAFVNTLSMLGVDYTPVGAEVEVNSTRENLYEMKASEEHYGGHVYPEMAREARKEGYEDVAIIFDMVSANELAHEKQLRLIIEQLEKGNL